MDAFGVQFRFDNLDRFHQLATLIGEVKRDKDSGRFRDPSLWLSLVPDDIKPRFDWPTLEERLLWLSQRPSTAISVPDANQVLGLRWDFYRVFESVEDGDYALLGCEHVAQDMGEIRINPNGYPFGGVNPFIALVEAFGFEVLGANECGRFESREELLGGRKTPDPRSNLDKNVSPNWKPVAGLQMRRPGMTWSDRLRHWLISLGGLALMALGVCVIAFVPYVHVGRIAGMMIGLGLGIFFLGFPSQAERNGYRSY